MSAPDSGRLAPASLDSDGARAAPGRPPRAHGLETMQIPPEAIRALPADFVKERRVLPLALRDGTLEIATAQPGNRQVIEDIRLLTGLEVLEREAPAGEILEKMAECYQMTVEKMIENLSPDGAAAAEGKNLHDIEVMANEPTVINLVNLIISTAIARARQRHPPRALRGDRAVALPD